MVVNIVYVEKEEEGAQDRTLGDPTGYTLGCGRLAIDNNSLGATM